MFYKYIKYNCNLFDTVFKLSPDVCNYNHAVFIQNRNLFFDKNNVVQLFCNKPKVY